MKELLGGDLNAYVDFISNAGFENSSFEEIVE